MKIENKFYTRRYDLNLPYFRNIESKNILVISDIHYQPNVSKELFLILLKYIQLNRPNYIVIPGDIFESNTFFDNKEALQFFEYFIRSMGEFAPVIIVPGNHDMGNFTPKNFKNRLDSSTSPINIQIINYLESLNKYKNVYFLNNYSVNFNDATFYGFNPSIGSYLKNNDRKTADEFIEDYIKSGLRMTEDKFNILLTHSPVQLTNKYVYSNITDFNKLTDIAIAGHLHDGYLPKCLDRIFGDTNIGLFITPLVTPYPGLVCRGIHEYGRGYLMVSQGFRKWTADVEIMNALEKISANDIETINISNGDQSKILRINETKPFA